MAKVVRYYITSDRMIELVKVDNGNWYSRELCRSSYGWRWTRWLNYGQLRSVERHHVPYENINGNELVSRYFVFQFDKKSVHIEYDSRHQSKITKTFRAKEY